ncbi:MAG: toprim domain-containing protein [Gammaproteobacteria bacterium]|nr:toprim domain-containing protein [Gammaproteobacteria bacterium]
MDTHTPEWTPGDAKALARALGARAEGVCRRYLPHGTKSGRYWMVGNVMGRRGRSMYVRLAPPGTPGWWSDAATGERGDLLELLRLQRGDAGMAGAMAEARQFLSGVPVPAPAQAPHRRPGAHGRSEAPRRLWAMCRPVDGTAAEAYLRARGIHACRYPALAFHPALYYRSADDADRFRRLPALVARVTAPDGAFLGVQRIYLDPARAAKANVPDPKKCMGAIQGGAVVLGEAQAPTLVVAEGVETALSVLTARPALRAAAALSAGGLGRYRPPDGTVQVLIARDGDCAGIAGAERLEATCRARAIPVAVLAPTHGDCNDTLLADGAETLGARIDAALARLGPGPTHSQGVR